MQQFYDPHEEDTVRSLGKGILKVAYPDDAKVIFFIVPRFGAICSDGSVKEVNLDVRGFYDISALTPETKELVRQELGLEVRHGELHEPRGGESDED